MTSAGVFTPRRDISRARARDVVVSAACRARALDGVPDALLDAARDLAAAQLVESRLVLAYADRLPAASAEWRRRRRGFDVALGELGGRLAGAGVEGVVIKSGLEAGRDGMDVVPAVEYGDVDLVVGQDLWHPALKALRGWGAVEGCGRLEPHKRMVRPRHGPAVHVHRHAEWFGVVAATAPQLRAVSTAFRPGLRLPSPPAAICLVVAHAVFQNLAFDLAELLELRRLAAVASPASAASLAREWGWGDAFARGLTVAAEALRRLESGAPQSLPAPLPALPSLYDGWAHAARLARSGRRVESVRAALLRPALVLAKERRRRRL
jgi:hypothetical protein